MKRYLTLLTLSFLSTASCMKAGGFDMQEILDSDPMVGLEKLAIKESALQSKCSKKRIYLWTIQTFLMVTPKSYRLLH